MRERQTVREVMSEMDAIAAESCNLRRELLASDAPERLDATIDQAWAALATAMAALKTNPDGSKLRDLLPKGR